MKEPIKFYISKDLRSLGSGEWVNLKVDKDFWGRVLKGTNWSYGMWVYSEIQKHVKIKKQQ